MVLYVECTLIRTSKHWFQTKFFFQLNVKCNIYSKTCRYSGKLVHLADWPIKGAEDGCFVIKQEHKITIEHRHEHTWNFDICLTVHH